MKNKKKKYSYKVDSDGNVLITGRNIVFDGNVTILGNLEMKQATSLTINGSLTINSSPSYNKETPPEKTKESILKDSLKQLL